MKRLWCLLAVLVLIFSCACAEESAETDEAADSREADLLDIRQTNGADSIWITAAVQAMDGMLLTSPALLPEKTDNLTVSDGQNEWKVKAVIPDSTGVMAMVFFDPGQRLPLRTGWPLMPFGDSVQASTCRVRSGNADGGRKDSAVRNADSLEWRNCRCLLLDLAEEAPPGSAVLNANDELVGIVIADYAEGQKRVLAMPVEEIVRGMTEAGTLLANLVSWGDPPEGFHVTTDKNTVTIDWSDSVFQEKAEGENLYLIVADAANDYLNYYPAETDTRILRMVLTPGRVYTSGILATAERPSELPEHYEVTVIPPAQRLTDYHFRPILTAVAEMPQDAKEGQTPEPVTEVTEELLRSGRAYFYSASTYEVEERLPDESLLVTLTDPEGNNYRYESSWLYAPEYMQEDIWFISLTETGLTYSLDQSGYPRGEYQLDFYVNGDLADMVTFELK